MNNNIDGVILLPHLRVQNANAISGPLSWGFPPPSAFAGLVHALHRKLGTSELPVEDLEVSGALALDGAGIVCHRFEPQVNKNGYRLRFNLSKNPIGRDEAKKIGSGGELPGVSIIEEGRAHLELSLLVGVRGRLDDEDARKLTERVASALQRMRVAGGSVLPPGSGSRFTPLLLRLSGYRDEDKQAFRKFRRRLLPGFALLDRHTLLLEHHAERQASEPSTDLLDTLLDLCALHNEPVQDQGDSKSATWRVRRRKPGWLVPLPVGYGGISPLYPPGQVKNTRDPSYPFCFVESLYSLGEWKSPHRIDHVDDLLWFHQDGSSQGLYLVTQNQASVQAAQ